MAFSTNTTSTARYIVSVFNHRDNTLVVAHKAGTLAEAKALIAAEVKLLKRSGVAEFRQYREVRDLSALGIRNETRRYGRLQVARNAEREVIVTSLEALAEGRAA